MAPHASPRPENKQKKNSDSSGFTFNLYLKHLRIRIKICENIWIFRIKICENNIWIWGHGGGLGERRHLKRGGSGHTGESHGNPQNCHRNP
jgi:hypothetical protein